MAISERRAMTGKPEIDAEAVTERSYVLDDQIGFVLRKAHQRASDIFNSIMSQFEVTPTQFATLARLHEVGETSQNRLGRMTAMDPATILGVVNRLKKRGLVEQRLDPNDGRMNLLSLTADGLALIDSMEEAGLDVSRRTLEPLSERDARRLLELLGRIA
jgi:DNA-binding MarR family transcriptional regulator